MNVGETSGGETEVYGETEMVVQTRDSRNENEMLEMRWRDGEDARNEW